jgi:RNA polymerase-binding transcription factor
MRGSFGGQPGNAVEIDMVEDRKEFFRALLEERMEVLLRAASTTIADLTAPQVLPPDSIDLAAAESNREFVLRLQERERRLVRKIQRALERIDQGEYGICVVCGGDISERRLLARPVATCCIDCQTETEQIERGVRAF